MENFIYKCNIKQDVAMNNHPGVGIHLCPTSIKYQVKGTIPLIEIATWR